MVGLKTFWITISALFVLASCVPQSKKSECGSGETFSTSLRACVPVVTTPTQLIHISSYTPTVPYIRYKLDTVMMPFRVNISNPYNRAYQIRWTETYLGTDTILATGSSTTLNIATSAYKNFVGHHTITADVLDTASGSAVVDTHIFQFEITDTPKPSISLAEPSIFDQLLTPIDAPKEFKLTVANNRAPSLSSYDIHWELYRTSGGAVAMGLVAPNDEDQDFTNLTATGSNVAKIDLDPSFIGIGTYYLKGRVVFFDGTSDNIIDERIWNITIRDPSLGKITNVTSPLPGVDVVAYDNLNYTVFNTNNWIYSPATQAQFCVTVNDADGTYPGDGEGVQVKWYFNGSVGEVCTKETNDAGAATQTLCLTDANKCDDGTPLFPAVGGTVFDPTLLVFDNPDPLETRNYPITARVYDGYNSTEYISTNLSGSPYSSPINWQVKVKSLNLAPTIGFGATNPTGCVSGGLYHLTACAVNQGEDFTVSFTVADDFFTLPGDEGEFEWRVDLKRNGSNLSVGATTLSVSGDTTSCVKLETVAIPAYASKWQCTLRVPHYDVAGPLDPSDVYTVVATVRDSGSPVGGTDQIAVSPLTWTLAVTETNPGTTPIAAQVANNTSSHVANGGTIMDPAGSNDVPELSTIVFKPTITDLERDDLDVRVSVCTTMPGCTTTSIIAPGFVTFLRSLMSAPNTITGSSASLSVLSYVLPEDILITIGQDIAAGAVAPVTFKVEVTDRPHTPIASQSSTEYFTVYVENENPAPEVDTALASPAVGSTTIVYPGFPLTIDPGVVTDDSGPASEKTLYHQWYASDDAGVTWEKIPGATTEVLKWTPNHTISTNIQLKLCVGDRPEGSTAGNPVISTSPECTPVWNVTPKSNLTALTNPGVGINMTDEVAVWVDDLQPDTNKEVIYSAYVGSDNKIYVDKTVRNASNSIVTSFQTVSFNALESLVPNSIKNLSIIGSANSLYIAYLASATATPTTMVPRVRRIDKTYTADPGLARKVNLDHDGKFGFAYSHYIFNTGTCNGAVCTYTDSTGNGAPAKISFVSSVAVNETIVINGATFTAKPAPLAAEQFCDSTACGTGITTAVSLAKAINESTQAGVQGLTAVANGADVELYGMWIDDSLDFDGTTAASLPVLDNGVGKLFVYNGNWYLPVVDLSRVGIRQANVTLIRGPIDTALQAPGVVMRELGSGKVTAMDTGLNGSEFVLARISGDAADLGEADLQVYDLSPTGTLDPIRSLSIFQSPPKVLEKIKLAPGTSGNIYYYVLAKETSAFGGEWNLGRYTSNLTFATESLMSAFVSTDPGDITSTFITDVRLQSPQIVNAPNSSEARLIFHSVGSGTDPYPYIAKVDSSMEISCGTCDPLSATKLKSTSNIAVSNILINGDFGQPGFVAAEDVKDTLFTLFAKETGALTYKPELGLYNIEAEAIQSTSADTVKYLWRPSFVK